MEEHRYLWAAMDDKEKAMLLVRVSQRRTHQNPTASRPELKWNLIVAEKKFIDEQLPDIDAIYVMPLDNKQTRLF